MDIAGYCRIPQTLFRIYHFSRSGATTSFCADIHRTRLRRNAYGDWIRHSGVSGSPMKRNWSSYYKWIEKGKWSWVAVGIQMARLLIRLFSQPLWHLIIDDTLILRSSKKAPGSKIYREHSKKPTGLSLSGVNAGSAWQQSLKTGYRLLPSRSCPALCGPKETGASSRQPKR